MSLKKAWLPVGVLLGSALIFFWNDSSYEPQLKALAPDQEVAEETPKVLPMEWIHISDAKLKSGQTFFNLLMNLGIDSRERAAILSAAKKQYDMRYLRTGVLLKAFAREDDPSRVAKINLKLSATKSLNLFVNEFDDWEGVLVQKEVETEIVGFSGQITTSLWESAVNAGMSWGVVAKLSSVFAWQIDFARELRTGARYRFLVEKLSVEGEKLGYGNIVAAEFENAGETHQAFYFDSEEQSGFFDLEGQSLKKMFLRSPVRFSRITSRFTKRRFHPVLKRYKAHNGVDYGASPGTPVLATGDGYVRYAAWRGAAGKHVQIRHNSIYETGYSHLKRFAKGIRKGKRVKQGQVIGYVGATGRVTGPHLHFAFYENGVFVDPLGRKFPSANPLAKKWHGDFLAKSKDWMDKLPAWTSQETM